MGLGRVWEWFKNPEWVRAGSVLPPAPPLPVTGNQRALALLHFKTHRRGHEEKNRKGSWPKDHCRSTWYSMTMALQAELYRPKTLLDLLVGVFLAKTTFLENKKYIYDISLTLRAYPVDFKS
ncbi:hypothetical protein AAG906_011181 [Vitis piasezkii]